MNLFEIWFLKKLIPHINSTQRDVSTSKIIVIGDNLASHFSPDVIKYAVDNNIYFTALPPNSTHILQPMDVGVFGPLKKQWRKILDKWRRESRRRGNIPKEQFPGLLQGLWCAITPKIRANLHSAFRATGLHPFDPEAVLK